MKKKYTRLAFFLLAIIAVAWLVRYTNIHQHFSLTALKDDKHFLKTLISENYYATVFVYILIFIAVISLAIPGSAALTLLGGYLFGALEGGAYAIIGSVVGATVSFLLFRYVFSRYVGTWYGKRVERFKEQINTHGASYLLMLHFVIVVPYFVINTLAAVTDISLFTFMWTTLVGCIPIVAVYAFAGRQLSYINSVGDIFSPTIIIAFMLLILVACMPIIIRKFKKSIDF